jgi:hypothetical protein
MLSHDEISPGQILTRLATNYIEKNNFVNDMSKEIEDKKNPKNMR